MRSSRLVSILLELTRSPQTTVAGLAQRHGVTARTVQRDIRALYEMGVPVWTKTGPGGGVGLVDGWRSPITGMTGTELQALIIGKAAARDLGMQTEWESAHLKMLTTSAQSAALGSTQERFLIDNERWFAPPESPTTLPALADAVWSGRRLTIGYQRPGRDTPVQRLVDPLGLVLKTDNWYLVAAHRRSLRTYRVTRIATATLQDDDAWRPPDFSLAEYWHKSTEEFTASIYTFSARLSLPAGSVEALQTAVPGEATKAALKESEASAERIVIELPMERLDIAVSQLLSVPGVEVLSPAVLRQALYDRGCELVSRNDPAELR